MDPNDGILKRWAAALRRDSGALCLAARDPRVPVPAKIVIGLVAAYALSPIDLIPDFIPVIGYLDDLLLLPVGIWLAVRLVPRELWRELRENTARKQPDMRRSRRAAFAIVIIWILAAAGVTLYLWRLVTGAAVRI